MSRKLVFNFLFGHLPEPVDWWTRPKTEIKKFVDRGPDRIHSARSSPIRSRSVFGPVWVWTE